MSASTSILVGSSVSTQHTSDKEILKLNEQMYKQNFELAMKNKTLSTLQNLYNIAMQSIEVVEVSQRITNLIVQNAIADAAFLYLKQPETEILKMVALSVRGYESISIPLSAQEISLSLENDLVNAYKRKEKILSSNLSSPPMKDLSELLQQSAWKTLLFFPLQKQDHTLGILCLNIAKEAEEISQTEQQTVEELLQLVTLAIDRAQLYESVQKANAQLKELDKLKDEFVSLASHELRTPMAAIKGSLSTILEGYAGTISDQAREFLSAAYNENDRLIRLVNNLLNTSRFEAGRLSFTVTRLNLPNLITDVTKNLQIAAKEKNLYLRYEAAGFLPQVLADEDKIKEVVINLIGNALKFTSQGGITIKTEVKDGMVFTSVKDTGTGIHREDFDLLFKKFSQVKRDQKYTKSYGGTGLGLYLSQKIIEGLGGKIWLDSEVGKGTTFCFTLPLAG